MTAGASEDVKKDEHSSAIGEIASWYNHSGNQSGGSPENWTQYCLKAQLYLGIYPKDAPMDKKDTCSTMFIAALFIIARSWKESRCPSTEEWIQKIQYIYTMELENIILSEVIQSQKNTHGMHS